jgi:hypothetical protein
MDASTNASRMQKYGQLERTDGNDLNHHPTLINQVRTTIGGAKISGAQQQSTWV